MDLSSKSAGAVTPAKDKAARSKLNESVRQSENVNPNVSSPAAKLANSPAIAKSGKSGKKSASRNLNPNPVQLILASASPKKKIRERKFVIAKKKARNQEQSSLGAAVVACEKCKKAVGKSKCLCLAYESLRASQEDFFRNRDETRDEVFDKLEELDLMSQKEGVKPERKMEGDGLVSETDGENKKDIDELAASDDLGVKRSRDRLLEESKARVRTPGSGKVMNLVKEFEKLSMFKLGDSKENDEGEHDKSGVELALDGAEQRPKAPETQDSSSSFCPSNFYLTSESLGLDPRRSYSLDSSQERLVSIVAQIHLIERVLILI